jgi:hypothetical protein
MTKPFFDCETAKGTTNKLVQLNPLWRAGQQEEIAKAPLFLASGDASYVNGHALVVDSGLSSSTRSCLMRDDARRLSSPRRKLRNLRNDPAAEYLASLPLVPQMLMMQVRSGMSEFGLKCLFSQSKRWPKKISISRCPHGVETRKSRSEHMSVAKPPIPD